MGIYAAILRRPGIALLVASTLFARLPVGINGLAVLLFVRAETGSFATAGAVTGAMALGTALGGPLQGRLVDHRGEGMLLPMACAHATGLVAVWALAGASDHVVPLAAVALVAGAAIPPSSSVLRSRWPYLLEGRPDLITGAYALDSVLIELIFVTGPLLTAGAVATTGSEGALFLSAASTLAGTAVFVGALAHRPGPARDRHPGVFGLGALGSAGLRVLVLSSIPFGFYIGSLEVALPAFTQSIGRPALAGVLLAVWSAASGVAGLVYGAHRFRASLDAVHLRFACLLPLACLPVALATSPLTAALLAPLAGLPIAPLLASRNELVGVVARPGTGAESFTWPLTAMITGASLGVAVGGLLVDAYDWSAPLVAGAALAATGAILIVLRRSELRPAREAVGADLG